MIFLECIGSRASLSAKGYKETVEFARTVFCTLLQSTAAGGEGCATIGSKSLEGASPACFSGGKSYP